MSRRVYLGRLPPAATKADIEDHFKGFRIVDIRPMGNFGFVEFESSRDAEDAVRDLSGKDFMGENLIVEEARDARRRDFYDPGSRPPPRSSPARRGVRINVLGVPSSTSWQDLKDYGRLGSSTITFADIDRNNPGTGVLEFPTMAEAEDAMKRLAGVDINGTPVEVRLAPEGGGGGYDDRRAPPPRDYGYDRPRYDDRGTGGLGGGDTYRGGGRYRSPPPPRRDYDRYDSAPRREYDRDRSPPRRREDDRYARGGDRDRDRDRNGSARDGR